MRKPIALMTTGLVLVLATIAMAASGEVVPVTTVSVHQIPSAVSIHRANEPIASVIFVGKVTAANGVPQGGRKVYLYSTYDRLLGTSITGTYAGHSQGYWGNCQMLWIGDDEVTQAATFSSVIPSSWLSSSVTRMPSLNLTPSSTSATRWWPLNRRQRSWAVASSL